MAMTMYTPLSELPHPPAFMIEEVEREERAYNTELLMRVLTIKEARPIRLELRKKLQVHPVAKLLHDASAHREGERRMLNGHDIDTYGRVLIERPSALQMWITGDFYKSRYSKTTFDRYVETLPEGEKKKLRNQSGKNKGNWNKKRCELVRMIFNDWDYYANMHRQICNPQAQQEADKYLRCGFWTFYLYNMDFNEWATGNKGDWVINLPPTY